jgi:hypothetical protein
VIAGANQHPQLRNSNTTKVESSALRGLEYISDFQVAGNGYVHDVALASLLRADGLYEFLKPFAWINVCRNFLPNSLIFRRLIW